MTIWVPKGVTNIKEIPNTCLFMFELQKMCQNLEKKRNKCLEKLSQPGQRDELVTFKTIIIANAKLLYLL